MKHLLPHILSLFAVLAVASFARAGEKSFVGDGKTAATKDWFVAANWDPAGIPGSDDDVTVSAKTVVATNAIAVGSLTLDAAANLTVGDSATRSNVSVTVARDLHVGGASAFTVLAGELADMSVFVNAETDQATPSAALWAHRNLVTVGGAFTIDGNSSVYPDNAPVSGTPVMFKAATVTLAEGSKIDAKSRGWKWVNATWVKETGAKPRFTENMWTPVDPGYTFAFGSGSDYRIAAGYGRSNSAERWSGSTTYTFGRKYGYSFAPFLPGSPGGLYGAYDVYFAARAPGSVIVYSTGTFTLNGSVGADGVSMQYAPTSGGGIWLVTGDEFSFGANASLSANCVSSSSSGGRIALAEGLTEEQMATCASGTLPDGFKETTAISELAATATPDGTLSFVRSASVKVLMTVVVTGTGSVTYDGESHGETFSVKVTPNESQTLVASADGVNYFDSWFGEKVTGEETTSPSIAISTDEPTFVYANFASRTATARSWTGSVSSRWSLGDNWSPAGVPGSNDTVTISTGSPAILGDRVLSVASVELAGASLSLGSSTARKAGTLATTGDLTLSGAAKLYAFAPELADMSVFATAETDQATTAAALWASRKTVTVGGAFMIGGTSVVYPDSAPLSGVPVMFKANSVTVAEGAKFNTKDRGWKWQNATVTPSVAGAKPQRREGTWTSQYYTYAFGAGLDYNVACGAYGSGTGTYQNNHWYGRKYGQTFAPFLSGSPGGLYGTSYTSVRAPGSVVVYSAGDFVFNGSVVADGTTMDHYPTTGGGVWLATGGAFAFGANASISSNCGGYGTGKQSSGGRIALAEGVTEEQMRTCASGTLAEGLSENPDITELTVSAKPNGTLSYVRSASAKVQVGVVLAGDGQVTYGGETYATNFTFTATPNEDFTLVASAAGDVRFSLWNGDKVAGGESTAATLTTSTDVPTFLYATFVSDTPAARSWTGSLDTKWSHGANWSPAGLPGANDTVEIKKGTVQITDLSRTVASLVVSNATLKVGTEAARGRETLTVTGDATLGGGAKMYVYGSELEDLSCFAGQETDLVPVTTALWNDAKVVTIGGSLTVAGSGTAVCPDYAPITGGAVVFRVGGDFTLGAGASFDASQLGWGWSTNAWSTHPAGAKPRVRDNGFSGTGWTLAPSPGREYGTGSGYGHAGSGSAGSWSGYKYGVAYGYALAPFLAGSPASWYTFSTSQSDERGSGAVVVLAKGTATIGGTIRSTPLKDKSDYGAQSGGGIWLCAKSFAFGAGAVLEAKGQDEKNYSPGGGGRIAVCTALSDAQIDSLARTGRAAGLAKGRVLDTTAFATRYPDCTVSVLGGNSRTDIAGTFRYVAPKKGAVLRVR